MSNPSLCIVYFLCVTASVVRATEPTRQLTVSDAQVALIAEIQVPAREAGVLADFSAKEGDYVEAGTILGRLDSDLAEIDLSVSEIELAIAKVKSENDVDRRYAEKSLEVAKAELNRSLASVRAVPKSISKTDLERLQLIVDKTTLSIEQAERDIRISAMTAQLKEQALRAAKKHIEQRRVATPVSGFVVEVFHEAGEWLDIGEPVVRIVRMDRLRVEAFVDGTKYGSELKGNAVQLEVSLPGDRRARFKGQVVFVSPEVQPVNGQARLWAEVDNPELSLSPGLLGTLTIDLTEPEPSTAVNAQATPSEDE